MTGSARNRPRYGYVATTRNRVCVCVCVYGCVGHTAVIPASRVDRDAAWGHTRARPEEPCLMGCLHDAIVAAIVGATGRTSVYTRQLSARLSAQL